MQFKIRADRDAIVEALVAHFQRQGFPVQGAEVLSVSTDIDDGDEVIEGYEVDFLELDFEKEFAPNTGLIDGRLPLEVS